MSLQVRLRHTLGERLLELPDRPVDEPVVVGRSSAAEVQVPSVTVSQRHCVLFVHEGRWAVQPIPGTAGTFVNGAKVEGPTLLRVGDVVTLGGDANAPAIDIDPQGAGRGKKGQPAGSAVVVPAKVARPPQPVQPEQPAYPAAAAPASVYVQAASPGYVYPVPSQGGVMDAPAEVAATDGGDTIVWPTEASTTARYYGRRIRRRSDSGLGIFILVVLAVGGGAAFFFFHQRQQALEVARQAAPTPAPPLPRPVSPTTRREEDTSQAPQSIFEKSDARRTAKAATRPGPPAGGSRTGAGGAGASGGTPMEMAAGAPAADSDVPTIGTVEALPEDPTETASTTRPDPKADDPVWKQVQAARFSQDRAKAILKFDEYARLHPDQFGSELTEYTDKVMDQIWFERLEQLCKEREALNRSIQQTDREISEETEDAYKKRVLLPLKEKYATRVHAVEEELKGEMKYDAPGTPNLLDDAQLDRLRRQRDATLYSGWKNRVMAHIRRSHGELPWGQ